MSLRYGYFDSEIDGYDEEGMPKFDRAESSDFLAMFISHIISDGVLAAPATCFQVVAGEGMNLTVMPGFGIVKGRFAYDEQSFSITLEKAPTAYKRIDRVVLRANYPERKCEIVVKTGTPAATPEPPELLQPAAGDYYELSLALININSNQSVVTQSSITDTRYDSSQCGLVTQLIDHLDTSVFFAQLNSFYEEFTNICSNDRKEYRQLMTQSKEEMEIDFNGWFNLMKEQLSEDAAGHLQLQIDEIKDTGICLIKVECEDFFKGKTVTATNGTETHTAVVPQEAPYSLLFKVKDVGNWNISQDEYSTSVSVPYFGVYSTLLSQGDIKITVNYDTEFEGKVISAKNGSTIRTKTAAGGSVSFMVNTEGTWEISAELDGKTYKSSVTVQHGHEYTVQLSKVGYQEWLKAGGVTTTFASLEEILADEKTIRQLITRHASSDYLAEWLSTDAVSASKILGTDIVAKWVNLRDYCMDKLYSYPAVKAVMDGLGKYGYGEWVQADGAWQAKGNVPVMTGNAAPYGEITTSNAYANNPGWKLFSPADNGWSTDGGIVNAWITYKFVNPCAVRKIKFDPYCYGAARCNGYEILAGSNNSDWESLYTGTAENVSKSTINEIDINNDKFYTYYRFHIKSSHSNSAGLKSLQFYGRELGVSAPVMISNSSPWGEIIFNTSDFQPTAYAPIECFKNNGAGTIANSGAAWIGYDFKNPVVIKAFKFRGRDNGYKGFSENAKIQGTNDLSQWNDVALNIGNSSFGTDVFKFFENKTAYRYWRVIDNAPYRWGVYSINFYGLDCLENEKRHWIYDHGVELIPLNVSGNSALATLDTTDYKLLRAADSGHAKTSDTLKCGSATSVVNGLPYNNYLDISNVNGSNEVGFGNRNITYLDETSLWLE